MNGYAFAELLKCEFGGGTGKSEPAVVDAMMPLFAWIGRSALSAKLPLITPSPGQLSKFPTPLVSEFLPLLELINAGLSAADRRKMKNDMASLKVFLEKYNDISIVRLIDSVVSHSASPIKAKQKGKKVADQELVSDYVRNLEQFLRDPDAFEALMLRLENDTRVKQPEAALIAKMFYGDASASTPKRDAFRRIWLRHNSLMDYNAKSRAQRGKSAA